MRYNEWAIFNDFEWPLTTPNHPIFQILYPILYPILNCLAPNDISGTAKAKSRQILHTGRLYHILA